MSQQQQQQQQNKNKNEKEEDEIIQEHLLLVRIDGLPKEIQSMVSAFSPVVRKLKIQIKAEFFEGWLNENRDRIMGLIDGWSKQQISAVLNSIVRFKNIGSNNYFIGITSYRQWPLEYMSKIIKSYINQRTWTLPTVDECPPIRIWGACKAIEECDARMKARALNLTRI
jgi:hypothetical protein